MKIKWNDKEYEGTPQELAEYGILQEKFTEEKFHQKELKQENKLELEKGIKDVIGNFQKEETILPTIFSTEPKYSSTSYHKYTPYTKWKGKVWSNYVPEFLGKNPQFRQVSKRGQKGLINNFLKSKLGISKVKPVLIRKFRNAIFWYNYKNKHQSNVENINIPNLNIPIHKRINWNKIALTWASLRPKPKEGIFLRKALGYIANAKQQKRFHQELDSLMLTKKIPIKQNTPLNYSIVGLKPKQHHIKRNWIQLATKYLDQKFVNPKLSISKFCEQEFGNSSGTRFQKLSQTLQQITTFKQRITEPLPKPTPESEAFHEATSQLTEPPKSIGNSP